MIAPNPIWYGSGMSNGEHDQMPLTVGEVAERVGRCKDTVYRWIRAGHLPARVGVGSAHRWLVERKHLEEFARRNRLKLRGNGDGAAAQADVE